MSSDDAGIVDDLLAKKPKAFDYSACVIVINNVPKVPEDKQDKLLKVLRKIFTEIGEIPEDGIWLPKDEKTNFTKGFAFVQYKTAEAARDALKRLHRRPLDKSHIFEAWSMEDFNTVKSLPDEYVEPKQQEYAERDNLKSWLLNESCADQFVAKYDNFTDILWNNRKEPQRIVSRENWSEGDVGWSPLGSYMHTFHKQGIALWGGPEFKKLQRFSHPVVRLAAWSPRERFLVTGGPLLQGSDANVIVWDARSGEKVLGFISEEIQWPYLQWSHDDKYFARIQVEPKRPSTAIAVFDSSTMKLLDNKHIRLAGAAASIQDNETGPSIKGIAWSPTDNYLAYWVSEHGNNPARVVILNIATKEEKSIKNLFNVTKCKLVWQPNGDILCVIVQRHSKTKKTLSSNFELFRVREKGVPVDSVDVKDSIISMAWEPVGSHFAVIHGDPGKPTVSVSFYRVEDASKGGKVLLLKTIDKKNTTHLRWSPRGQFIVLAALKGMNSFLEFWDIQDFSCLQNAEHIMATNVEWDPTGRFVASVASCAEKYTSESGFCIWSLTGRLHFRRQIQNFFTFSWRPRPKTLLSEEDMKRIKKNLAKTYSPKFDRQDALEDSNASKDVLDKRRKLMDEYEQLLEARRKEAENLDAIRQKLRPEQKNIIEDTEEIVDVFISQTEEIVS